MLKNLIIFIAEVIYACVLSVTASILLIIGYAILSIPLNITVWIGVHVVLLGLDAFMQLACFVKSDESINVIAEMIYDIKSYLN